MPLFNPDKITRLVSEMRKALSRLKSLATLDKESFLNDPDKIGSAKYYFVIAIESCIDLCNHIISQNSYRAPEDYADTFQVLGEQGVFQKDFFKTGEALVFNQNRFDEKKSLPPLSWTLKLIGDKRDYIESHKERAKRGPSRFKTCDLNDSHKTLSIDLTVAEKAVALRHSYGWKLRDAFLGSSYNHPSSKPCSCIEGHG